MENKYALATLRAVELCLAHPNLGPQAGWKQSSLEQFGKGTSGQTKGCPRHAFLGLCEHGMVKEIPAGKYTGSKKNKKYAVEAVVALRRRPELARDPEKLWKCIMRGEEKEHNSQMYVVVALWKRNLLN